VDFNPEAIRIKTHMLREELRQLGPINPLAQDEYREVSDRVKELVKQKQDIETSMQDLEKICLEIDESSKTIFVETFTQIQKNFHQVFRRLFHGGKANIEIMDGEHPLEAGIEIFAQPPGKKFQNINLFSGGERSLIAVALMFSIFLVKPSPICLLDEVDAALDKENINRLARLLAEFKDKTQFIIISHNEKTVGVIDYLYGVTMQGGVTQTLSLKLDGNEKIPVLTQTAEETPNEELSEST
jgi:chromosome segregation protein